MVWALQHAVQAAAVAFLAATAAMVGKRRRMTDEAVFLQATALELRAGASLRSALDAAADRAPHLPLEAIKRRAAAGVPIDELAGGLQTALPRYGRVAAAALTAAAVTGGRVAGVFDSLAQIAAEDRELDRERRAATATARLSAWVVGGLPFAFLLFGAATGRFGSLVSSTLGVAIVAVGAGLIALGGLVVSVMLRRALP